MLNDAVFDFFSAFFGSDFDSSILTALCVCFSLVLVYGLLIRPVVNWIGGFGQ